MKFEQHIQVIIKDTWHETGDEYTEDGIEEYADSDGLSSAEEAFLRGYLAA